MPEPELDDQEPEWVDTGCPPTPGPLTRLVRRIAAAAGREYGPAALLRLYNTVHAKIGQTKNGGIVGDRAHRYGYHRCRAVLRSNDYSVVEKRDKGGDQWAASALDITFTDAPKMHAACQRLMDASLKNDPRLSALREWFGTIDGRNVTGYSLLRKRKVTSDSSHLWHIHLSVYRDSNEIDARLQQIAAVISGGTPTPPKPWDGKSFPGADKFRIGSKGPWVTLLGQRLVVHGWTGYSQGPGPEFTETDRRGVEWFQRRTPELASDPDGYPGPLTWRLLMAAPPKPPEKPVETAVWIAQFNVQRDDWRKPGDEAWSKSLPKIVGLLKDSRASILILNECDYEAAGQIASHLGDQWTWDRVGVNVVMRDKHKYAERGLIEATLPGNGTRSLVAVKLERDGIDFTVGSTHLDSSSDGYQDNNSASVRRRQMAAILDKLGRKRTVFGGDMNDASRDGVRAQARAAGFRTLDDCVTVKNSNIGTTDDKRNIDECFVTDDMQVTEAEIRYVGRASDHNLQVFRLVLNPEVKP